MEEDTAGVLREAAGNVIAGRGRLSAPTDDDLARAIAQLQERAASNVAPAGSDSRLQMQLPVLVENPCGFDTAGRQVMSVSVGLPHAHKPEDGVTSEPDAAASGATASEAPPPLEAPAAVDMPPPQRWQQLHATAGMASAGAEFLNPLWERRLTQTEPAERDAAADRFRVAWGAPPSRASEDTER